MMSLLRAKLARGKRHGAPVKSPNGSIGLAKNLLSVNGVVQKRVPVLVYLVTRAMM